MMTAPENEKTGEKLPETAQLGEADIRRLQDDLPFNELRADKLYGGGAEGYTDYPVLAA